jgi:hypothetical protein
MSEFLVGGPAYSGTTLLAFLLNQPGIICLDEPDFEKPSQPHRGIPVLRRLFPDATFPPAPVDPLTFPEAFDLFRTCGAAIHPTALGFKTCNRDFVSFARLFRDAGLPVVAVVRDIRDALVRPLPSWVTEGSLNTFYRMVWENIGLTRAWIRYENLVCSPHETMAYVGAAIGHDIPARTSWASDDVPSVMFKDSHHDLLRSGGISSSRVGIWRQSGRTFSRETTETALMMGYDP